MTALAALTNTIRATLVLALVGFLAFGSLAGPVSAAMADHHAAATALDGDHGRPATATANCPAKADGALHEMGDGSCCVGTCTTILGVASLVAVPSRRIDAIEAFHRLMSERVRVAEFLRPPSLTI